MWSSEPSRVLKEENYPSAFPASRRTVHRVPSASRHLSGSQRGRWSVSHGTTPENGQPQALQEPDPGVNMASEMATFTKFQILQQAGISMLARANTAPQGVLGLPRQ